MNLLAKANAHTTLDDTSTALCEKSGMKQPRAESCLLSAAEKAERPNLQDYAC